MSSFSVAGIAFEKNRKLNASSFIRLAEFLGLPNPAATWEAETRKGRVSHQGMTLEAFMQFAETAIEDSHVQVTRFAWPSLPSSYPLKHKNYVDPSPPRTH